MRWFFFVVLMAINTCWTIELNLILIYTFDLQILELQKLICELFLFDDEDY